MMLAKFYRYSLLIMLYCLPMISHAQMVTLNFKDMDINLLIDTVAEVTKKTFIVDQRVKGNITVVSSKPMDSEQVYQVFLSILGVHGFAAVPSGEVVKIVPQNVAKSENIPVLGEKQDVAGDALVTQVIQVEHVSAPQLIPLLRPLIPQQGHLVAYPSNNTLIMSDTANNIKRIEKIIQRIDKVKQEDIEIVMLTHASAAEIARIIDALEHNQAQAAGSTTNGNGKAKVMADERTNSILISGDESARLRLRTLIAHLDTPVKEEGKTQVIYLRYARAADLVEVLRGVGNSITEQKKTDGQLNQAQKISIQADESTNSLVITAAPEELRNLRTVISQLDVRRAQVLVEAVIAEVSTDTAKELGVQWILGGRNDGTVPIGASNFTNLGQGQGIIDLAGAAVQIDRGGTAIPTLGPGTFLGLGRFASSGFNFALLLKALSSDTNTNVLSTPSLLTLDNQAAQIHVGQNIPFITGQYTNTGAGGTTTTGIANPFQTIDRQDIGLKLKVVPQINEGNAIQLEIEQEVSNLVQDTNAGFITNNRSIKTTVIVEDGNMVVLGGLIDEDLQQTTQKVPGLGDIPLVGGLFRSQSTKKVKRNLMVFLHPTIIRDAATETLVSNSKYTYMRAKQLEQKARGVPLLSSEEIPVLPSLDDFLTVLPETNATHDSFQKIIQ